MKHWGKALFGIVVTVLALWWALADASFSEIWAQIRLADPWLLLASVFVGTFGFFIRALRWKVFLTPLREDTGLRSRFAALSIGFMANNVLPARVGEFARAYALSRVEPVAASAAFGTLFVERFMDGLVLLLFLVLPILSSGFPAAEAFSGGLGRGVLIGGGTVLLAVLALLVAFAVWPRGFVRAAEWMASHLPERVGRLIITGLEAFLQSFSIMRDPILLLRGFTWSVLFWAWHGVSFWLAMLAFGIDTGFVSAIFVEAVVGFGVAVPSAPGFIGTFHASVKFALTDVYGVSEGGSLAYAFGYHFANWIPITVIGLWYAWKLGFSLGEVGASEDLVEEEAERVHELEGPGGDLAAQGES